MSRKETRMCLRGVTLKIPCQTNSSKIILNFSKHHILLVECYKNVCITTDKDELGTLCEVL